MTRWFYLAVAATLAACHATPSVTPAPAAAPAARACPAPELRGVKWVFVDDSAGFVIALPPGFQERNSFGPSRHWEPATDFQSWMGFGIIRGELGLSGYRRAYQSAIMPDYSECSDAVSGYPISIQAWRTPNGTFRNYRRYDRYDVFAIWEVRPGVYAWLAGGTDHQPTQVLMLAAIRSWKVQKP